MAIHVHSGYVQHIRVLNMSECCTCCDGSSLLRVPVSPGCPCQFRTRDDDDNNGAHKYNTYDVIGVRLILRT